MINPKLRLQIRKLIDSISDLKHLGVVLAVDGQSEALRSPQGAALSNQYIVVDLTTGKPEVNMREVAGEGIMAAINCSAAIVAAVVTIGVTSTVPLTGGASALLTGAGYAATLATGFSCGNSAIRTFNAISSPGLNQQWDTFPAYKTTLKVLDGVSLLGVGASAIAATRAVKLLKNANIRIPAAITGQINRQQGAKLSKEIIRSNHPGISNGKLKQIIKQGRSPKRYPTKEIRAAAVKQLKDSVASGLSFLSSALDGNLKNATIFIVSLQT